jgi:hypothetical protein
MPCGTRTLQLALGTIKKMRNLFIILLMFSSVQVFSQKRLTLIIDTIDFVEFLDENDFNVTLTNQGVANSGEILRDLKISTDSFPNLQTTVSLKSDSTSIQLPIDIHNGYLELSNIYKYDTLRINKLCLYSNCHRATTKSLIDLYRVKKDSLAEEPYKQKFNERTSKEKCKRKPPSKTMYLINNERYLVSIQKTEPMLVKSTSGQGYKPAKTKENNEGTEPYTGTLLGVTSSTYRPVNKAVLRLK